MQRGAAEDERPFAPVNVARPDSRLQLHRRARLRKVPGVSPTTLNVGLAQRTRELSRATRVQSISARQAAKLSVT
jgi:hypothetical protein